MSILSIAIEGLLLVSFLPVAVAVGCAHGSLNAGQTQAVDHSCEKEHDDAIRATIDSDAPDVRALRRRVDRALALFRFHRSKEAQAQLDSASRLLDARPSLLARENRSRLATALASLQRCVLISEAPAMATLAVRTFKLDETASGGAGGPAGSGIYVRVDEIPIGRTIGDGTLKAQVPSGTVRVTAIVPPTSAGEKSVTLSPGGAGTVSLVLDDGKQVADETDLVLTEANDGIVPSGSRSLKLQFRRDERLLPVTRISHVELLKPSGDVEAELRDLFRIEDGAIVAVDVRRVLATRSRDRETLIRLRVTAVDAAGFWHSNVVEFRVE